MHGTPGSGWVRAQYLAWDKRPRLVMPGTASFLLQLKDLPWNMFPLYFGGDAGFSGPMERLPCINFMADADILAASLRQAAAVVRKLRTPCFNHPSAVLASGRDAVSRVLKDVPGLQVPTTVKVCAMREAQLLQAMEATGIEYPVIVRMAGDQGGVSTIRVDGPDGWEALNALPWDGRDVYLTQYVDFSDEDGYFRNIRLGVVGRAVLPCFRVESGSWLLRPEDVPDAASGREKQWMNSFAADVLPGLQDRLTEVAARLKLDCFAVDASLRPDGSLLLFEANACNPTQRDMRRVPKLVDAVRRLLAAPVAWHGQAART